MGLKKFRPGKNKSGKNVVALDVTVALISKKSKKPLTSRDILNPKLWFKKSK